MAVSDKKRDQMLSDAQPAIQPGEQVLDVTSCLAEVTRMGTRSKRRASLILTDQRVVVFSKKLGGYDVQDYVYGLITKVEHKVGMVNGHIALRASGDLAELSQVDKQDCERIAQAIRSRTSVSAPSPDGAGPARRDAGGRGAHRGVLDAIAQLGELRDRGVVSDAEFEAKKAELLGRL